MNDNPNKNYYGNLFKDYPDVVKVKELKEMLPRMGKNKIYDLLKDKKIYSNKNWQRLLYTKSQYYQVFNGKIKNNS